MCLFNEIFFVQNENGEPKFDQIQFSQRQLYGQRVDLKYQLLKNLVFATWGERQNLQS